MHRRDVDALMVTPPHHVHISETLAALETGKHAFVEKPLATTVEDCDRMIEEVSSRSLTLSVGYHQRFCNNNSGACRLICQGSTGDVLTVQVSMLLERLLRDGGRWGWWDDPRSLPHQFGGPAPFLIETATRKERLRQLVSALLDP